MLQPDGTQQVHHRQLPDRCWRFRLVYPAQQQLSVIADLFRSLHTPGIAARQTVVIQTLGVLDVPAGRDALAQP